MPPQTLQEQEDAIVKRFGGAPVTTTPTVSSEEADIVKRFGGVPKPRTYAETLLERERARLDKLQAPPVVDTYQGDHIGPAPSFLDSLQTRFKEGLKSLAESTAMIAAQGLTGAGPQGAAEADRLREVYTRPDERYDLGFGPRQSSMLEAVPVVGGILGPPANRLRQGDVGGAAGDILSQFAVPEAASLALPHVVAKVKADAAANRPVMAAEAATRARVARAGKEAAFVKDAQQAWPTTQGKVAELKNIMEPLAEEHAAQPITNTPETVAALDKANQKIATEIGDIADLYPHVQLQVPVADIEHALATGGPGPNPHSPAARGAGTRIDDVPRGMAGIETLQLDQPQSVPTLYSKLLRLNAELDVILGENQYDVAVARKANPVFRAKELAAEWIRHILYPELERLGHTGIRELRQQQGDLIEIRSDILRHQYSDEAMTHPPGTPGFARRAVGRAAQIGTMTVGGAVTGGLAGAVGGPLLGVPAGVAGAAVSTEAGAAARNRVLGNRPRAAQVERAMRNLNDIPDRTRLPGSLPTVEVMPGTPPPGGGPGGPGAPGGAVGFPRWTPPGQGPLPTVTVLPPEGPAGLGPGTPPLALPPAPPRQLGPAVREMPAGNEAPDFRAPRIPPQTLPTTWEELKRFYQGEDLSRGIQQQPNIILDILSLPPEERALAIAELERSTPPPVPPDTYTRPERPAPTPPPSPPAPTGQLPLTDVPEEPPPPPPPPPSQPAPGETPPAAAPLPSADTGVPLTGDLVADVQASLMDNGSSNRGMDYWRDVFKEASPQALKSLATWMAGPAASSWVKRFMLPDVQQLVAQDDQQGSMFGDEAPPAPPKPSTPTPVPTPTPAPDPGARAIAANVSEVDPRSIKVDPERFQFKSNFDPSGVVPESRIKGAWNENLAGMLLTWVDPVDGHRYVINGHNRLAAAVSKNVPRIIIRDVQAADAAEARAYGAMANIAENNGSPVDAAKVLRHATDPAGKLKELGIDTTRRLARDGLALAQLSDPLFQRVATGDLNEALGIAIGRAQLSPENQMAVVQLVERQAKKGKKLTPEVVAHLIEDVQDAPTVEHTSQQGNMFADLLGEDRSQSVAIERAQIRDWLQTTLEKDKRLFKYVQQGDRAARLAAEGNVINKEANVAKAQESATIAELVKKLANAKGPINDALTTAAVNTAAGQDTGAIRAKLLEQVKRAIEFELGGGTGAQ